MHIYTHLTFLSTNSSFIDLKSLLAMRSALRMARALESGREAG